MYDFTQRIFRKIDAVPRRLFFVERFPTDVAYSRADGFDSPDGSITVRYSGDAVYIGHSDEGRKIHLQGNFLLLGEFAAGLEEIYLDGLDFSGVKDISHLFAECGKLTSADLSGSVLNDVEDISHLFDTCYALKKVVLPPLPSLEKATWAFGGCLNLDQEDITGPGVEDLPLEAFFGYLRAERLPEGWREDAQRRTAGDMRWFPAVATLREYGLFCDIKMDYETMGGIQKTWYEEAENFIDAKRWKKAAKAPDTSCPVRRNEMYDEPLLEHLDKFIIWLEEEKSIDLMAQAIEAGVPYEDIMI